MSFLKGLLKKENYSSLLRNAAELIIKELIPKAEAEEKYGQNRSIPWWERNETKPMRRSTRKSSRRSRRSQPRRRRYGSGLVVGGMINITDITDRL